LPFITHTLDPEEVKALRKRIESIQAPKGYKIVDNGKGGFDVIKAAAPAPKANSPRKTRERKGGFTAESVGAKVNEVDKEGKSKGTHTIKSVDADGNATLSNGKTIPNFNRYYKRG
jgi:hypothetical protein